MMRKVAVSIIIVLLVIGGLVGVKALQIQKLIASAKSMSVPPETISSSLVQEEQWQETIPAIASITAVQGVTITPEISGIVKELPLESGTLVAKGDVLVRLDTAYEEAQLRAIEAQVELAKLNAARAKTLRAADMISQSELDIAEATLKQNQASADAIRTTIEKKTIKAPFAGRLGIRMINVGQYLDMGKPIVSLQSLVPIYASYSLPQQELAKLSLGMQVRLTTDAFPGKIFDGKLTAINPDIDPVTRSLGLQATFENAEQLLRPGMFARVETLLPEQQKVLVIPATSVLNAPYGDSVYMIESKANKESGKSELIARQQFIRVGRTRGDFVSVETGLKVGERIASTGAFKLRNGMVVQENNTLVPKNEASPQPKDG